MLRQKDCLKLEDISPNEMRDLFYSASQLSKFDRREYFEGRTYASKVYGNIKKSENDDRQYRVYKLVNGLMVCLISDPDSDQAAAALTINFGNEHNYIEGFAHLYQHVLYASRPNNKFAKYVKENSGVIDSQTFEETTMYYFDVKATKFKQALQQFAKLFQALPDELTDEYLEELITDKIYTEGKKTRETVNYRLSKLFKWNIAPNHIMTRNKFGTLHTIYEKPKKNKPSVKDCLTSFFPAEYGADLMSLCIVGKESLNDLYVMVLRFFSSLPKRRMSKLPLLLMAGPSCKFVHKIWCRDIATDESRLYLIYSLRDINKKLAVERYFIYLLTYRGEKTFASVLESKGWITCIEAIKYPSGYFYNFINIGMKLTEEGLKHVDDIIALFFQYKNLLRERIGERWMYNEFKEIQELKFRYETKQPLMNYVQDIGRKLLFSTDEDINDILRVDFVPLMWNKTYFKGQMSSLLDPSPKKIRIFVIDKSAEGCVKESELMDIEPECLIPYKTEIIPKEICTKWMKAPTELKLPARNEFIPTVASLKSYSNEEVISTSVCVNCQALAQSAKILQRYTKGPIIVKDSRFVKVWHKRCPEFDVPKVNTIIHFTCPDGNIFRMDIFNLHMNFMFVRLIKDSFRDYVYAAALVDLKWEIYATDTGIQVEISGFDNKQHVIIERIIDRMINLKLDAEMFEVARQHNEKLSISQLKKIEEDQPYNQAREYFLHEVIDKPMKDEIWQKYTDVTFEAFEKFTSNLLSIVYVECLIHGNMTELEALAIGNLIETKLRAKRLTFSMLYLSECSNRISENCHVIVQKYNKHHYSSSTKIFYQIPRRDLQADVLVQFIQKIIEERCCELIEKELAYYVHCGVFVTSDMQGLTFLIHGRKHIYMKNEERVNQFITRMAHYIKNLSVRDFLNKKSKFITSRYLKPKIMNELSKELWNEIITKNYNYMQTENSIECIKKITLREVYDFYQTYLNKFDPRLSVYIISIHNKKD